jgi:dihydrofolate reductase
LEDPVRKLFSFMITSAGGYHADPGQALDWQILEEEFGQFAVAQLRGAGTLALGRATCELMAAFWPTPAREQSGPGVVKAMSTTPKIVISRGLAQATWPGTQIISNHAEEELTKLKTNPARTSRSRAVPP